MIGMTPGDGVSVDGASFYARGVGGSMSFSEPFHRRDGERFRFAHRLFYLESDFRKFPALPTDGVDVHVFSGPLTTLGLSFDRQAYRGGERRYSDALLRQCLTDVFRHWLEFLKAFRNAGHSAMVVAAPRLFRKRVEQIFPNLDPRVPLAVDASSRNIMREALAQIDVPAVDVPDDMADDDGFMLPAFAGEDSEHGNAKLVNGMLPLIAAKASQHFGAGRFTERPAGLPGDSRPFPNGLQGIEAVLAAPAEFVVRFDALDDLDVTVPPWMEIEPAQYVAGYVGARLTGRTASVASIGRTGGLAISIPPDIATRLAGRKVRVHVVGRSNGLFDWTRYGVCYSTDGDGNSQWRWFLGIGDMTTDFFDYVVPTITRSKGHVIAVTTDMGAWQKLSPPQLYVITIALHKDGVAG